MMVTAEEQLDYPGADLGWPDQRAERHRRGERDVARGQERQEMDRDDAGDCCRDSEGGGKQDEQHPSVAGA
ncbi:hypothetical protein D3C83_120970 [compost metagenome]